MIIIIIIILIIIIIIIIIIITIVIIIVNYYRYICFKILLSLTNCTDVLAAMCLKTASSCRSLAVATMAHSLLHVAVATPYVVAWLSGTL